MLRIIANAAKEIFTTKQFLPSCSLSNRWNIARMYHHQSSYKPEKWNEAFVDQALKLIGGVKTYDQFTPEEKQIVDRFQEMASSVDGGVVFTNTKADLEQKEFQKKIK